MHDGTTVTNSDPLAGVAQAMANAVEAAKSGVSDAADSARGAIPRVNLFLSRMAYTTSYAVSYGVVFPTVFIGQYIPKNNALVHGLSDGAAAAKDAVTSMKAKPLIHID
jgi:hypothetical protein